MVRSRSFGKWSGTTTEFTLCPDRSKEQRMKVLFSYVFLKVKDENCFKEEKKDVVLNMYVGVSLRGPWHLSFTI
jgi:hypothetical protein